VLKIFLELGSLPSRKHHPQHRWQIDILADNAVGDGTLPSPLLWGQGHTVACLHPSESTRLWLCVAEASGEMEFLLYATQGDCALTAHSGVSFLVHDKGKNNHPSSV